MIPSIFPLSTAWGYGAPKLSKKIPLSPQPPLPEKNNYFQHIVCLDFKQIDVHAILLYKIDPLGRVLAEKDKKNAIPSPMGLLFHQKKNILPQLIEYYLKLKETYKNNKTASRALDHLIEWVGQAVTNEDCRFYSPALTNALNSVKALFRETAQTTLKNCGYEVAHAEDSRLYVSNNQPLSGEDLDRLLELVYRDLGKMLEKNQVIEKGGEGKKWVPSLRVGPRYDHFFVTQIAGAKNTLKYVHLANRGSEWDRSENFVSGDVVSLYHQFEKDLFYSIFHKQNPLDVIKEYIENTHQGKYNELLFYRKKIVKKLKEYEEPYPPHVQAARKVPDFSARWVEYVLTSNGGEPKGHVSSPINLSTLH